MQISNMTGVSGREIPNQFVIEEEGRGALGNFISRKTFQSYKSTIAIVTVWPQEALTKPDMKRVEVVLDEYYWDYSRTTGKYRNLFLGETKKETEAKIASGEYKLTNLNKD